MPHLTIRALLGLGAVLVTAGCAGGGSTPQPIAAQTSSFTTSPLGGTSAASHGRAFASSTFGRVRRHAALAGPAGFAAMKVALTHNVFADEGFVAANFAKQYGIGTIFLEVDGDDIGMLEAQDPQTVANLNAMFDVADVYVWTGNSSWLATPATVPSDVNAIVRRIAPLYPRFAGILYDIEPTSTQGPAYFQLLDTLLAGSQPYAFGTTMLQTSPSWWRWPNRTGGSTPSMLQEAESYSAVSQTYMQMNGNSATAQFTHDVTKALPMLTKPYWSEANARAQGGNSYLGQTATSLASNLTTLASELITLNPQLSGVSVSEWDDRYSFLETILPQPMPTPGAQPVGPLVPTAGQRYLGAFVNPDKSGGGPTAVASFEASIGRKLAYDLHFASFASSFDSSAYLDDAANGRVPLVAMNCADSNANVAAGVDDAALKASAATAVAYGHPIFLRFLWEMNLPVEQNRRRCWDPATDLPGYKLSPTHFIAAFRHMRDVFVAAGATNVIWVWNESGGGPTPAEYYPGNDAVDWVGIDDYNRTSTPFLQNFAPLLNSTAQYQKPIMISETGALPSYQTTYFPQITEALQTSYPLVKALSYFDSSGGATAGNWTITGQGIGGFAAMGAQTSFTAFAKL